MDFLLHNDEGIAFPPLRPAYVEGDLFFERFRALTPRGSRDSVVGEGGTGLIHLVRDELMDRVIALKLPHESVLRDPSARFDVIRETRQAIELTHPHIVRIHDFHEGPEGWGISMQYVRGKNLDEWRHEGRTGSRRGPVPYRVEQIENWMAQLCDALIYAHEDARMVHRDIKPKNLMLERHDDGREKLLLTDFGITQKLRLHTMMLSRAQPGTTDKSTMGTLPYMPWDQIQGAPASTLDDVYAVGATIYELLTGRPPFYEGGYEQIRVQIEKVAPPPMAQRLRDFDLPDHGIPAAWEETVAACLAKRPQDRPQSVREIAARLGLAAGDVAVAVAAPAAADPEVAAELTRTQDALEASRREAKLLESQLSESSSRIAALEMDLDGLRESMSKGLEEGQREMLEKFSEEIAVKDRDLAAAVETQNTLKNDLASAVAHQSALQTDLAALQEWQVKEEAYRSGLEVELAAAKQQASAGSAELEKQYEARMTALQQAAEEAKQQAARERDGAAARVQEAEKAANARAEQRVAEANQSREQAAKQAEQQAAEARKATAAADEAQKELSTLKTRQTAPLMPLFYVLLGTLAVGGGAGVLLGKMSGGSAEAGAQLAAIPDGSTMQIPDQAGKAGEPVSAALFEAFLADQGISGADAEKAVPGIGALEDGTPVRGVSWWVAESFCAWLGTRELDDAARNRGSYFRIATEKEITAAGGAGDTPEWTSDPGLGADSAKVPSARKVAGAAAGGDWQVPSLRTSADGKPLGFRVTLVE